MKKEAIRLLILKRFNSIRQYCKKFGLNEAMLVNWLNDKQNVTEDYLNRILSPLGLALDVTLASPHGDDSKRTNPLKSSSISLDDSSVESKSESNSSNSKSVTKSKSKSITKSKSKKPTEITDDEDTIKPKSIKNEEE